MIDDYLPLLVFLSIELDWIATEHTLQDLPIYTSFIGLGKKSKTKIYV